jgi:hypothetical protein
VKKRLELFSFAATVVAVFALGSWVLTSWNAHSLGTVAQAQQATSNSQQTPPAEAPPPRQQNQAPQQTQPPAQSGQTQPGAAGESPADGHEFVGTIVKQGDKYMFQDSATGQMYDIDHQDEVRKFDGKKVRVRGTLDPQAKMIHVQ